MYQEFASNYDRFNNWDARLAYEMPFILSQLQSLQIESKGTISVLDSACGTGMHAIQLAKTGYELSGADLYDGMIEKAETNAKNAGVSVDFRPAGFGSLAETFAEGRFDAVLCLGNSLPHLLSTDEVMNTLQDFRQCLAPGGILIIQNRNFDNVMQHQQRWMEPQAYKDESGELIFHRFYDFEPSGLIRFNIMTLQRQPGQAWEVSIADTMLRPLLSAELIEQLASAGFRTITTYGDMTGNNPFDPNQSPNLVIAARLPL